MKFNPGPPSAKVNFGSDIDESLVRDRNVLITGGGNGLGALLSTRMAQLGATVTIADWAEEDAQQLANNLKGKGYSVQFVKTDVRSWESQVNAFKTAIRASPHRSLDLIIPCAGLPGIPLPVVKTVSLDEDPPPPSRQTFDVVLIGVYYTALLALHYFRLPPSNNTKSVHRKHLLMIGSLASYLDIPPMADYAASKFGVRGLWRTVRREFHEQGFRTNLIAPTFMPTQVIKPVAEPLEEKGAKVASLDDAVAAVMRAVTDESIEGRSIAVGGFGNFDMRDDHEGLDGGEEILRYFEQGGMGEGMHSLQDILGGRDIDEDGSV